MRVGVVVATPDLAFRTFLNARKDSALPTATVRKEYGDGRVTFAVLPFAIDAAASADDFGGWLDRTSARFDGLIVLIDAAYAHLADAMRDAFFVISFASHYPGTNHLNRFGAVIAPILKNYSALMSAFLDLKFRKVLLLPLANFKAQDLVTLRDLVGRKGNVTGFGERLLDLLAKLRDRQTPKKRASYQQTYLVDDAPWYFAYGHEHHASAPTGVPPHEMRCRPNSRFRFGLAYDTRRHWNVSDGHPAGTISGSFACCHGPAVQVAATTHINMFPNDYH